MDRWEQGYEDRPVGYVAAGDMEDEAQEEENQTCEK